MNMRDDFVPFFVIVFVMMVSGFFGFVFGLTEGRKEVASGQVRCELVTNKDKTTSWGCATVR